MWQQVELALSQSAHRVLVKLAIFLPAFLALLLAIIILTAIGAGLAALVRRFLTAAKFDERLARNALVPTAAMVLDHLQIGGAVVELAFGILFGGIVLTLALAVGLGSRDIVSRSLERSTTFEPIPGDPDYKIPTPTETLRHF